MSQRRLPDLVRQDWERRLAEAEAQLSKLGVDRRVAERLLPSVYFDDAGNPSVLPESRPAH
jgi:hypothetical protein